MEERVMEFWKKERLWQSVCAALGVVVILAACLIYSFKNLPGSDYRRAEGTAFNHSKGGVQQHIHLYGILF